MDDVKDSKDTKHIGELIKSMRKSAGMSQVSLAERIGVSYQQVQKYEKGTSQLNIRRLLQFADAFGVPVGTFLNGSSGEVAQVRPTFSALSEDEARLVMLFRRLKSSRIRTGFLDMLRDILKLSEHSGKS